MGKKSKAAPAKANTAKKKSIKKKTTHEDLDDSTERILSFVGLKHLAKAQLACKKWHQVAKGSELVWKSLFTTEFWGDQPLSAAVSIVGAKGAESSLWLSVFRATLSMVQQMFLIGDPRHFVWMTPLGQELEVWRTDFPWALDMCGYVGDVSSHPEMAAAMAAIIPYKPTRDALESGHLDRLMNARLEKFGIEGRLKYRLSGERQHFLYPPTEELGAVPFSQSKWCLEITPTYIESREMFDFKQLVAEGEIPRATAKKFFPKYEAPASKKGASHTPHEKYSQIKPHATGAKSCWYKKLVGTHGNTLSPEEARWLMGKDVCSIVEEGDSHGHFNAIITPF